MLNRIVRSVAGRTYEIALNAGVAKYRRPWPYSQNVDYWHNGYAAGEHDHYESLSDRPRYGAIAGYLGQLPGKLDILDVGCGQGIMRERIPDEKIKTFLGVDLAPSAIERAQSRNFPNSEFRVGSLQGGPFDAIICNEVLYYPEDTSAFLRQAKALLRPHGLLITSVTRYHGESHLLRLIADEFRLLDECVVTNSQFKRKWRVGCYRRER